MLSDVIRDMIGESGDRGTSILEYLTNLALFFADACMILAEREQPQPLIGAPNMAYMVYPTFYS